MIDTLVSASSPDTPAADRDNVITLKLALSAGFAGLQFTIASVFACQNLARRCRLPILHQGISLGAWTPRHHDWVLEHVVEAMVSIE